MIARADCRSDCNPESQAMRLNQGWLLAALLLPLLAHADVIEATASGFQVKETVQIDASPHRVYATLIDVGAWWDPAHSYSGKSTNMHLAPKAGGCWCETLAGGGGVQHMTVVLAMPDKRIILSGGLGPLQTGGLAGAMTWQLEPKNNGTEFSLVYNVGGYAPGGLVDLASGVDSVLHAQVDRLKQVVETEKLPSAKPAAVPSAKK
jgi:uncharacterized protein YndB with AHSA1/START domain